VPLTHEIADLATAQYVLQRDRFVKLGAEVAAMCESVVRESGIPAAVHYRAKKPASFHAKLRRYIDLENRPKIEAVVRPQDAIDIVGDLAGVRVATYVEADRERVVALIDKRFRESDRDRDPRIERMDKPLGYRATHCQVLLPTGTIARSDEFENVANVSVEIQVCSMLAHVWNEIEHDLRYKDGVRWGEDVALRDALLDRFKNDAESGDAAISRLLMLRNQRAADDMIRGSSDLIWASEEPTSYLVGAVAVALRLGFRSLEEVSGIFDHDEGRARGLLFIEKYNQRAADDADASEWLLRPDERADILLACLLSDHAPEVAAMSDPKDLSRESRIATYASALEVY